MNTDSYTISETMLDVGHDHKLYIQEWGNQSSSKTFIFLHGGPGGGCSDKHKAIFDPKKNHVIFFDQRGSGKSTPYGSLKHNTTKELVADINKIRQHFGLDRVVLVGGSWGSTLALAYAVKHPNNVEAMILRGIFTGTKKEVDFLDEGRFEPFFPDVWHNFLIMTPKEHHNNPSDFHIKNALGDDEEQARRSAYAMSYLEGSIAKLDDRTSSTPLEEFDPNPIRIELWYTSQNCFLPDNYIYKNASQLKMSIWLIQGRYDAICPPITAYKLYQKLPDARLIWTLAGHSGNDRNNFEATKTVIESLS